MMNQIFCILMLIPVYMQAQNNQKIGHADWEYIFSRMPEFKQIENELKTYEVQLQNQLKSKSQELEAKYKSYQSLSPNIPETIRKDKESELAYLQENIEKFRRDAQASIEKKQNDLVAPVFTRVGQAIEAVAQKTDTPILSIRK